MAFSFSWLCILLLCLVPLNDAWLFGGPTCNSKRDCKSCVSHKSWSGQSCRWCPRDKECHAHGAIATNPCSRSENVVNANACDQIVTPVYDKSLAVKMVYLSSLAYADNVASYIGRATEVNSFRVVSQITKPCEGNAKCSGFVAVSHAERAIVVSFRGSEHQQQILVQSLQILTVPKVSFQAGGRVQKYFNDVFVSIWNQLKDAVYREITRYRNYKVWVTGHSLGGALASLASTVLGYENRTPRNNLILYTFGQPRVGDYRYALRHDMLVPISFRITHFRDPVVHLPTCNAPIPFGPCTTTGPYHHGKEIYYGNRGMTKNSSYKECQGKPNNEDYSCSNNPTVWASCFNPSELSKCLDDHAYYFGIRVGNWYKSI